jgi:hypothetical protein
MFLFFFLCAGNLSASTRSPMVDGLRNSVLALDSAWNMALSDLQQKKREGLLQDNEKRDYAKFITFLSTKIGEYCSTLRSEGGEQAVTDLPCPDESAMTSGQEISYSPTRADQVAELDKSLTQALGEFDEQLLKEEQKIASRLPAERESGSGGYGGGGMSGSGGQSGANGTGGGAGSQGTAGTGSQAGSRSTGSSTSGTGKSAQTSAGGAGAGSGQPGTPQQGGGGQKIESGYDDIVARQLREAAEKETDPELKKKLWEEYRKYKEGTG